MRKCEAIQRRSCAEKRRHRPRSSMLFSIKDAPSLSGKSIPRASLNFLSTTRRVVIERTSCDRISGQRQYGEGGRGCRRSNAPTAARPSWWTMPATRRSCARCATANLTANCSSGSGTSPTRRERNSSLRRCGRRRRSTRRWPRREKRVEQLAAQLAGSETEKQLAVSEAVGKQAEKLAEAERRVEQLKARLERQRDGETAGRLRGGAPRRKRSFPSRRRKWRS